MSLLPAAPTVRRPLGVFLTMLLLVPLLAGCTKGVRTDVSAASAPTPTPESESIVAATLKDGRDLEFDRPGGQIARDTLFAYVEGGRVAYPMEEVDRVVIERRQGDTLATVALVVGVTFGVLLVSAAIYAATKESCPFVYAWDGERYVFDAEPYGGAITAGLERDDYSPLESLRPDNGEYRLRLTNEVNETQHTNFVELWVVDHEPGARVAADADGTLYDIRGRVEPTSASDGSGRDLLPWLARTDRLVWEPMAVRTADGGLGQEIVLTFPRPPGATEARLVVNASTGLWGSHMIREFVQLRGTEGAAAWFAGLDTDPEAVAELHRWTVREGLYVLPIYVEEPTGWEMRGTLRGEGPFIAHDRVVTLDVSRATGDELRIRIRPPAGFWALNSFGIDYSAGPPLALVRVPPRTAVTSEGGDVLSSLARVDDEYHVMPDIGDRADVSFPAPAPVPGRERSVILHTRGYYELHLDPEATADETLVRQMWEVPGTAVRHAADLYAEWTVVDLTRRAEAAGVRD